MADRVVVLTEGGEELDWFVNLLKRGDESADTVHRFLSWDEAREKAIPVVEEHIRKRLTGGSSYDDIEAGLIVDAVLAALVGSQP